MDNQERFNIHSGELKRVEVLLPIGTILSIKENEDAQVVIEEHNVLSNTGENFDYKGSYIFDGVINSDNPILFNKNQIAKIHSLSSINNNYKKKK